jgi:hypothetical protein
LSEDGVKIENGADGDIIGRTTAGEKVISQENVISRHKGFGKTKKKGHN